MARQAKSHPTDAELAMLSVLWERGPLTVPEVWEAVKQQRKTGYTTILKQLQVMEAKGFVVAEKKRRPYLYRAAISKDRTQRRLLTSLIDTAFGGSINQLVLKALTDRRASADEIAEVRRFLDELGPPE